jgi:hypothetical protein
MPSSSTKRTLDGRNEQDGKENTGEVPKPVVFRQRLFRSIGADWGWSRGRSSGCGTGACNGICGCRRCGTGGTRSRWFAGLLGRLASHEQCRGDEYDWNDVAHKQAI